MDRCALCPGVNNCVPGDGPAFSNNYVAIGEAPGIDEDKRKKVFCGKTGNEYENHYLKLAGLRRDQIYTTNAIHCLPNTPKGKIDLKREPHLALLESCTAKHLYPELEARQPKLIIPMGAFANYAIDPAIELERHHGMPLQTKRGLAFPMYHPAGGIHEPKKMLLIRTDWIRLGKYLQGKLTLPQDEYEGREDYRHLIGYKAVEEDLWGQEGNLMACDTETTRDRLPFCLTYSVKPGTGRLIRADDVGALSAFQTHLNRRRSLTLFHNWLFDGAVVGNMGLMFNRRRVRDTMVKIFHLGNLPQGLKTISYRELGMMMKDFEDVVTPHAVPLVLSFYHDAFEEVWERPPTQIVLDEEGQEKEYKPQSFGTKLKRFFTDYEKSLRVGTDKNIFDIWKDNWADMHEEVEGRLGRRWPGKCITYAPFDEVLQYAVRDADATLRLWMRLIKIQRRVRKGPQETWADAA